MIKKYLILNVFLAIKVICWQEIPLDNAIFMCAILYIAL